jgi:hypothetical protein
MRVQVFSHTAGECHIGTKKRAGTNVPEQGKAGTLVPARNPSRH